MLAITTAETTPLINFSLPGTPCSVQIARFYVRAALAHHGLENLAGDAQTITSELVTNVIEHTGAARFSAGLLRLSRQARIAVVVSDPSPFPPVKSDTATAGEHGRGLCIVEALSASWGWQWSQNEPGKVVYAVLAAAA